MTIKPKSEYDRERWIDRGLTIAVLAIAAIVIGAAYVVFHFVCKYW